MIFVGVGAFGKAYAISLILAYAQYGWTPLMSAARGGHADCVRVLLDAGADKEVKRRIYTDHVRGEYTSAVARALVAVLLELQWRFFDTC